MRGRGSVGYADIAAVETQKQIGELMVQEAVRKLSAVNAQLTDNLDAEQLAAATKYIDAFKHPLSSDDIRMLMSLMPESGDTAASLNWSLLHAIEAAPDWPIWEMLDDKNNEWIRIFCIRLRNAGFIPPDGHN